MEAVDLHGLTGLTVRARVLLGSSDGAADIPASNFSNFRTQADELLRVAGNGSVDAFVITQPNTQVGGTFPRVGEVADLRDAHWHDLVMTYDAVDGLEVFIDGVRNPAASKGGGSLDSDMEGGAFFIGANAGARSLVGRVEDVSVSNVRRPDAWIQTQAHDRVDLVRIGGAV
jgi:hypothetical protein